MFKPFLSLRLIILDMHWLAQECYFLRLITSSLLFLLHFTLYVLQPSTLVCRIHEFISLPTSLLQFYREYFLLVTKNCLNINSCKITKIYLYCTWPVYENNWRTHQSRYGDQNSKDEYASLNNLSEYLTTLRSIGGCIK